MPGPKLEIDLRKICANSSRVTEMARDWGVELMTVTKGLCGDPRSVAAMVDGGADLLGDARLTHIRKLRAAGITVPIWLIRPPALSDLAEVIDICSGSFHSDPDVISALSRAVPAGTEHPIILMIDMGTGREGVHEAQATDLCADIETLQGVRLKGLGLYFNLQSTPEELASILERFAVLKSQVETALGRKLEVISGGSSNVAMNFYATPNPKRPDYVTQLRIGTLPLIGRSTHSRTALDAQIATDAFVIEADVIEAKRTSSGRFALLEMGTQDLEPAHLLPLDNGVTIVGGGSDHTLLALDHSAPELRPGSSLRFAPYYYALARAMASTYVEKVYLT